MDAFATIDDLERRWRPLSENEQVRAEVTLGDVSDIIRDLCHKKGIDTEVVDEIFRSNLRIVTLAITKRMICTDDESFTVKTHQQMAGPFMSMDTYETPSGEFYIRDVEKDLLGLKPKQTVAFVSPQIGAKHEG